MTRRETFSDIILSVSLFILLLFTSLQLGGLILGRQDAPLQREPLITMETVRYLTGRSRRPRFLETVYNPREFLSLKWLRGLFRDSRMVWLILASFFLFLGVGALRTFRTSTKRKRIEAVAQRTLEISFVLTTIAVSLSPFLAFYIQGFFFPAWRLHLGGDQLLAVLYPILINELVLALAATTLLAGVLVSILLIVEPKT
jgi:hypothetical protein